jgi:nicotinamidase-related amidase
MSQELVLHPRWQVLQTDERGYNQWVTMGGEKRVSPRSAALLLCDVWDKHWSRGADERLAAMLPRMNAVVSAARARGVQIVHAPSDTMPFYAGTPARQRAVDLPRVEPPAPLEHPDPPLPVDASDHGSDTGETQTFRAWSRQHPAIEIDQQRDIISDNGREVYSLLQTRALSQLLIMGVHTNMCILNRSFAIKQMVRWGVNVMLLRDLTDTMYNPAMPPYVSHAEGTRLVIEYIEKFWCPTIESADLLPTL